MPDDYKIKIETVGNPAGAQAVEKGLKAVGTAADDVAKGAKRAGEETEKQGRSSKEAARSLNQLGEATEKGAAVGRVFGEVARGNILALGQLGPALKAIAATSIAGTWGVLLIALTAVWQFLPGLMDRLRGTKQSAEDSAKGVEALTAALAKAGTAQLEGLKTELAAVHREAKLAGDALQRIYDLQERGAAATKAADLAEIENKDLTPAEKEAARQEIEDKAIKEARARADKKLADEYAIAEQQASQTRALENTASEKAQTAEQNAAKMEQQRAAAAEARRAKEIELENTQRPALRRIKAEELEAAKEAERAIDTPETRGYIQAQKERAANFRKVQEDYAQQAQAAEDKRDALRQGINDPAQARIRTEEDRGRRASQISRLRPLVDREYGSVEDYGIDPSPAARKRLRELEGAGAAAPRSTSQIVSPAPAADIRIDGRPWRQPSIPETRAPDRGPGIEIRDSQGNDISNQIREKMQSGGRDAGRAIGQEVTAAIRIGFEALRDELRGELENVKSQIQNGERR